jgi:hypothetical protein
MSKVNLDRVLQSIHSKDSQGVIFLYKQFPEVFSEDVISKTELNCKKAYDYIRCGENIAAMDSKTKFQYKVAGKYVSKLEDAAKRGLEFSLTLTSVSNLLKAKKCFFTGLPLDDETMTFDRVDNSKGYIQGNTVACHKEVNAFKAHIENPLTIMNLELVSKMVKKWEERL